MKGKVGKFACKEPACLSILVGSSPTTTGNVHAIGSEKERRLTVRRKEELSPWHVAQVCSCFFFVILPCRAPLLALVEGVGGLGLVYLRSFPLRFLPSPRGLL